MAICGLGVFGGGLARFDGREFKVYTTLDGCLAMWSLHCSLIRTKTLDRSSPRV